MKCRGQHYSQKFAKKLGERGLPVDFSAPGSSSVAYLQERVGAPSLRSVWGGRVCVFRAAGLQHRVPGRVRCVEVFLDISQNTNNEHKTEGTRPKEHATTNELHTRKGTPAQKTKFSRLRGRHRLLSMCPSVCAGFSGHFEKNNLPPPRLTVLAKPLCPLSTMLTTPASQCCLNVEAPVTPF